MRIVMDLQACQTGGSRTRGIGRYSMALALAMVRNAPQHEFWIVLNGHYVEAANAVRAMFDGLIPAERIRLFDLPGRIAGMHPSNDWRREAAELMYEAFLDSLDPDIVHFSSYVEGYHEDALTSIGRQSRRYLVATTLYDLIPLINPDVYLVQEDTRRWYYRKVAGMRQSDLLLAISGSSGREAVEALGMPEGAVTDIAAAVDDVFVPQSLSERRKTALRARYGLDRPYVMYTGGIDFRKNIEGLILAYASLPPAIRDGRQLAIVCSIHEADRTRLTALAHEAGLQPQDLVCTGYVPEEDLVALYNLCELFVFPSLHEGFGLPALEAMACGAPTIGADNSSIPEVIGNPEALFDARDRDAMRAKIVQALTDRRFREELVRKGRVQASLFSWDRSAKLALEAMERASDERRSRPAAPPADLVRKPRLAFVSPLPPLETGIAAYSAELLPELARHYEIELISDQPHVSDPWLIDLPLRSTRWFADHSGRYDRIVYQFGNSHFHADMFALLADHPGTVILHDGFLGHVQIWREHHQQRPDNFARTLVDSHGPGALFDYVADGPEAAAWRYPATIEVARAARGVIVHSDYAASMLADQFGLRGADEVRRIHHLRALPSVDRAQARQTLGLSAQTRLLCSFGGVGLMKRNLELVDAFAKSRLAADPDWRLVFVGSNEPGQYGKALEQRIKAAGLGDRISITGFASTETYRAYLAAADGAVQLRSHSRAETSGAVLDCLAYGLPLVVNAHGTMAEVSPLAAIKLPDDFAAADLVRAIDQFGVEGGGLRAMGGRARAMIRRDHDPALIAVHYRDAIERFATHSRQAREAWLMRAVADLAPGVRPDAGDLIAFAATTSVNLPAVRLPSLYLDISTLVQVDAKSGVQRVVREMMMEFLRRPPKGYRVEPVYACSTDEWPTYRHARQFVATMLGLPNTTIEDDVMDGVNGDIFLGLDLAPHPVIQYSNNGMIDLLRARGVKFHFVIYDLLPILQPELFDEGTPALFDQWLRTVARVADGAFCISRAVASELAEWLDESGVRRDHPLRIGHFPLGSDFAVDRASPGTPDSAGALFAAMEARRSLLMVGTLEPRKAHAQMLDALETIWAEGVDVNLVIVGKRGWLTTELADRIEGHVEHARRLWWEPEASDEYLDRIYAGATVLLAGSRGEGFGLPLIEAARHGKPAIARDLPVFREIAGPSTTYFRGDETVEIATVIKAWLADHAGSRPAAETLPVTSWHDSANALRDLVLGDGAVRSATWVTRNETADVREDAVVRA